MILIVLSILSVPNVLKCITLERVLIGKKDGAIFITN